MRAYLIAYDLANPHRNKHALATQIMAIGASWARPLEQTWLVRGDLTERDIELCLAPLLEPEDGLMVQSVEEPAQLVGTSLRWFRHRRPGYDLEAGANVIAFPAPEAEPPRQSELPLAS